MQATLSSRSLCVTVFAAATLLFSITASSQVWTFRNGFGQSGATNGLADIGKAVCTDAAGNVYITGKISDDLTGNTVSFGGAALVSAGDDDGFVAKFNSSGVHQWSIRFGGTSFIDIGNGIATDGTSVYVTGSVNGNMTVGTSATIYPDAGTGIDGFVMKLDAATGTTVSWVTRFGGGNTDEGQAICLDPSGNVYVSGIFRTRTANPTATFGSFTPTVQGNFASYSSDLFAAQLNPTTGAFNWVSTGGDAGGNDNIQGSGICYVPSLSEVVVTGSYRSLTTIPGSLTANYSTASPISLVTLTNSSVTTNEDFCLLEIAAATGAFISGSGVGSGDGNELGLGAVYDSNTGDVFFAGSFSSASVTFPGNPANTNPSSTRDNVMYGRYNPSTNAYTWVKDADNGTSSTAADAARAIASNGTGNVFVAGNFRNTITFPGGASVTASGAQADVFVAKIDVATGNAVFATQGVGTSSIADDIGYGIATAPGNNAWITGQYASSITFSPLAALASSGGKEDILLAKFNDPPPAVVTSVDVPGNSTYGILTQLNFTVHWSEAVTVTGTPFIAITIGSTVVHATYVSGSGTTSLLFRYVVSCNDFDNNGIAVGSAINLNGGTIVNTAATTVNANPTLNNVGSTAGVNVSALAPVVNTPTVTQPSCATPTGTIVVNATGNGVLEYSINNGSSYQSSNTFGSLSPGNYNIIVRFTSTTCATAYSGNPVVINPAPSVTVNAPTVTQPDCTTPTGTIVVNATGSGPLEYSIDNGGSYQSSNTFGSLAPNSYNIVVRVVSTTCTAAYSGNPVVINAATGCCDPITMSAPTVTQPTCTTPTGTIVVNATGTSTLEFSINGTTYQSSAIFGSLAPGVYYISARYVSSPQCKLAYSGNPVILIGVPGRVTNVIAGSSPFQDSLWTISLTDYSVVTRLHPTLAGFTITGMNGLATHPLTGETYIILKLSGVSGRVLGKINLQTGVCTQIGNLGDNFSSITFRYDGQLFGTTGNGATVPETMYLIDQTNAAKVVATPLGNGADGEIICFNPDDNFIYHWSGNGIVVYEKIQSVAPYTVTNIPIIGSTSGETFGAYYKGGGEFITSNIGSTFNTFQTTGQVSPPFGNNPDDLRGLVARTCVSYISPGCPAPMSCGGSISLSVNGGTGNYQWYKNGVAIGGETNSTYTATTGGVYNAIFTDQCGVTDSASIGVTVTIISDVTPPTITCPANITVNNDANQCGAVVTYSATANDNCSGTTISYSPASGSFFPVGTTTVTATATDGAGLTASCTFTVTVVDAQNPSITCPANITRNNDANQCGAVVTYAATASDNCPGVSVSYSPASGSFFPVGTTTVTATATDAAGHTASCTFTVTVVDAQNPSITCPANITKNNDPNQCGAVVTYAATASDNCPGVSVSYSPASGSFFPVGTTTVTATATDAAGRTASCTFTVTVVDAQPPTITCPANITVNNDPNQCGAVVTYAATASDNCPGVSVSYSPASGSFFPVGTTTVTVTATDAGGGNSTREATAVGNTSSCTFTVTVVDAQNPSITCPANITRNNDPNQCGAVVTYAATVSDNCPGVSVSYSPASGSFFPVGTTTVTATATDAVGRTASCTFTVTVADAQNPSITCPANITKNNDPNQCGAVVTYAATASDNCPGVSVSYSPASGSFFPVGTTTVTATATDAVGHTSSCTFTVTVADAQNPTISCPANITKNNDPNQCGAVVTFNAPTASDNCPGVTVNVNHPSGSFFPVGTTTVTATATDAAGHTASCTFTVTVADAQNPTITCPANITVNNATGQCGANVTFSATASDNCPGTIISYSKAPGSFFNAGTTTVTATATDAAGHAATCTFTVKVVDTQGPTITCPANITQIITSGCSKKFTPPNPTVIDNCGLSSLIWCMTGATTGDSPASGINYVGNKTFNTGETTITYTATDIYGNTSVCSFTVTILETVPPSITCPPNKTVSTDYGYCYWSHVNLGTPRVSDNCGVACVTNDAPDIFPIGTTVVTWTVTDNSGNTKSCTQTITVLDTQNPSVTCPANIYQNASAGCVTTVTAPDPTYYDNCTVAKLTWVMTGATTGSSPSTGINFVGTKNYNVGTTTITYTIKDAANNSWSCSFAVTITDVTNPTITCPANITQPAASGACNKSIIVPDPTYSDNCGVTKLTWYMEGATNASSPTSGINKVGTKTFNVGVTTVTYTAWDPWGNSKQCTFTVTVTDNQPPVVVCPTDRTLCKVSNNTYTIPAMTRTDNCGIATTTYQVTGVTTRSGSGTNASGLFNLGLSTITWTVTDVNGNIITCSTNVTIVPAGSCRLVSNDPKDGPQSPDTKLPKEKLDVTVSNSQLEVTAYPNPTDYYFNVKVKSASKDAIEIKMYDGWGKVVQQDKGAPDQTYRFGDHVVGGIYFIEVRQGKEKVVIKIFKL